MGEYDKEKFSDELNGKETRLIGKEEMDELKLENEFEPLDKDLDFDKELGDVAKFIDTIKPKKWEYRSETLALTLISLEDPQKRKEIEKELYKVYPDKRVHYTNEYKNLLKNLCEKQG